MSRKPRGKKERKKRSLSRKKNWTTKGKRGSSSLFGHSPRSRLRGGEREGGAHSSLVKRLEGKRRVFLPQGRVIVCLPSGEKEGGKVKG